MNEISKQIFIVPAGKMSYVDTGPAAGATIVFVHGNPASSAEFVPAIEQLRSNHRCIAVDHIGFGDSDKPVDWDYLPASHAANLAAFLDQLALEATNELVGAITQPQRVG